MDCRDYAEVDCVGFGFDFVVGDAEVEGRIA